MNYNYLNFLVLFVLLFSCQNPAKDAVEKSNDNTNKNQTQPIPADGETKGDQYSQEKIDALISALRIDTPIDTLNELRQIDCGEIFEIVNFEITIDTINKYSSLLPPLNPNLQKLLLSTHCFKKIKETANFSAYFFLTASDAHYSSVAKLLSISKQNKDIHQIKLSYHYGNELGTQSVSSTFNTADSFIRKTEIKHNYIHGIGKVDSLETRYESYNINQQGLFVKLK